jgi:predicted nuclease of predicted toxin-antitoxin system
MTIWVDAQLPPAIASWITENYEISALPVRDVGLRDATDEEIFAAARAHDVIVLTKDRDFVTLWSVTGRRRTSFGSPAAILPTHAYGRFLT